MSKKTEIDERAVKLPPPALWLKLPRLWRWAKAKGGFLGGVTRWIAAPALFVGLVLITLLVLVQSFVLGWLNDLPAVFKHEDDTDLRRKFVALRWVSIFNTSLLAVWLAAVAPATVPFSVVIIAMAVTNRLTAHVRVRKLKAGQKADPYAPSKGFVRPRKEQYPLMVWTNKDGETAGSFFLTAFVVALLVPAFAFITDALATDYLWLSQAITNELPAEFAWVTLVVPAEIRFWILVSLGVVAVSVAAAGGRVAAKSLRTSHGHVEAYRQALREKLILVLSQESASGQKQFMSSEEAGLLKMVQKGAEWEITLPVNLMPALRNKGELRRAIRRELDTDRLKFELVDEEWEGHFTLAPVGPTEQRIRDNLRASGGTPENGGLEMGLTEADLGFDEPGGTEELLPRALLQDLGSWEETAKAAAQFAELGLQLVGYNVRTRKGILEPTATATPRARWKPLNLPVGASERAVKDYAERLARQDSAVILDVDVTDRRVFLSPMLPAVAALRSSLATELKTDPTKVGVAVTWSADERVDSIDVVSRAVPPDPDTARELWRKVINAIPGGSNGWRIFPDAVLGITRLQWGATRVLPTLVDAELLLPERAVEAWETEWSRLPLGVDSTGGVAAVDLKAGPHAAIIGSTGSGKSVAARLLITQAILRGFEVVGIDPTKKFGGLTDLVPYTKGFFTESVEQAADVMTEVYAEVQRRVALNEKYSVEDWEGLPVGTVRPWCVVVDEWASLVEADTRPAASTKGTVDYEEWESETASKGRILGRARKLAREARSAGVHLILLSQIANVEAIPSAIRENLGTSVQLKGKRPVSPSSLDMLFKGQSEEALREFEELKGGKGLAVSMDDGDTVRGFRVGLLEPGRLIQVLEERGARKPEPLVLPVKDDDGQVAPVRRSAPAPRQSPAPVRKPVAPAASPVDDFIL